MFEQNFSEDRSADGALDVVLETLKLVGDAPASSYEPHARLVVSLFGVHARVISVFDPRSGHAIVEGEQGLTDSERGWIESTPLFQSLARW